MRMDVSGSILVIAGAIVLLVVAWFAGERPWWVLLIASKFFFVGWLFVYSGAKNLWEVYKDKKARRKVG